MRDVLIPLWNGFGKKRWARLSTAVADVIPPACAVRA